MTWDNGEPLERPSENTFGANTSGYQSARQLAPEMERALRGVDSAFAGAQLSDDFSACPHCYTDPDLTYLRVVPPCEMSNSDLAEIIWSLTTTIGSARDVAYFVPALLRLQFSRVGIEDAMVMKRLAIIPAEHWTLERREALRAAYEAYFHEQPADGVDLDEPDYRTWIKLMLNRPPHSAPFDLPIPGWDDH